MGITSTCSPSPGFSLSYDVRTRTAHLSAARAAWGILQCVACRSRRKALHALSEDGDVYVVKAGPQYELLASNSIGEVLMASPAISDGTLFFRGLRNVFAIKQKP